ncbi:MAG: calcium-binding protein [Nocardioides sp.]|nr:calcium-binding protein [Nocardioides sp.]
MKTILAATVTAVLLGAGLPASARAVAPGSARAGVDASPTGPTCRGKAATIVGPNRGERTIVGTSRSDVIVTDHAQTVRSHGGDDLVCVDRKPRRGGIYVYSGSGDDQVLVGPRVDRDLTVELGAGSDLFVGGPGDDRVSTDPGPLTPADDAADVVRSGAGSDVVRSGGTRGTRDLLRLGPGDDEFRIGFAVLGDGRLDGGRGRDEIALNAFGSEGDLEGDAVIDATAGAGKLNGAAWLRFGSVEDFSLPTPTGGFDFTGRDVSETLSMGYASRSAPDAGGITIDMAGGDDAVRVYPDPRPRTVDGGPGDDRLDLEVFGPEQSLVVDASVGTATTPGAAPTSFTAFETYAAQSPGPLTMSGTDAAEQFLATSCGATIDAAGGDDRVESISYRGGGDFQPDCYRTGGTPYLDGPLVVRGGAGDDTLLGGRFDDDLDGGDGTDAVDGRGGSDTCVAESVTRCEQ